ncbi:hypothetical protein [Phenylobacterium sp.]|uniref:hypothetical protein n=1 Tax=Phenylobacterium sp. TaxID=1871053 RepID=UPI002F9366A9
MSEPSTPPISEAYRREQQSLHENPAYGVSSIEHAPLVKQLIEQVGVRSLTDYGAGKQHLKHALSQLGLEIEYHPYDPAFPEYGEAQPAELVCCIDVLEHIEPEFLDRVLDELKALTRRYGFLTVHTGPAKKVLSDGRNAHLVQQPSSWWMPRICDRFEIETMRRTRGGFFVVVSPRAEGA